MITIAGGVILGGMLLFLLACLLRIALGVLDGISGYMSRRKYERWKSASGLSDTEIRDLRRYADTFRG